MKKIFACLLIGVMMLGLTACSGEGAGTTDKDVDLAALFEQIQSEVELPMLTPVDDETLTTIYGINPEDVEAYAGGFSMMNVQAADIIMVKAKDDTVEAVRSGLEGRIEQQKKSFENYLADQYEAASSAEVEQYGNYLVLVILAQDADTVRGTIADAFA